MIILQDVFTEEYRPKTLDEVLGNEKIVGRLKSFVKGKDLPNILFSGEPGVGKTTCALAFARDIYGKDWRSNLLELNASDERGIDVVRTTIKDNARTLPVGVPFKIIFLDEVDNITKDAQAALRRIMEDYSHVTRFILCCNYPNKIIKPIRSRCAVFSFKKLEIHDLNEMIKRICDAENLEIEKEAVNLLSKRSDGDMRRIVTTLQCLAINSNSITLNDVAEFTGLDPKENIRRIMNACFSSNLESAFGYLDETLAEYTSEEVLAEIFNYMEGAMTSVTKRIRVLSRIGDVAFYIVSGSNERLQLKSFLAWIAENLKGGPQD